MAEVAVETDRSLTGWYRQSTPKVRRVFWTCAAAWGLDSMDGFVYQYMIPAIVAGLGLTLAQAGSIASANYFAGAIGGWTGGWLADRYGRARVLQVTILWFSIFSFLSGFAQDYEQLLVLAHPSRLRLRRGMGGGCGAARRARRSGPSRQGDRRRAERRRARLDDGRPAGRAGRGMRCRWRWAGAWRSSSACCPRCSCSSCAGKTTMPTSSGGPRRARRSRAAPSCRSRSSDRSCAA